ncbi:TniB family NTP-binding protein [Palleronia caenipelagi]|nr:TniB family NTP-binding protein [Palleronia caenipelagi]
MTHAQIAETITVLEGLHYRRDVQTTLRTEFDRRLYGRREEIRQGVVREGRGIALLGASGSGKSTVIEHLLKRHPELVLPDPGRERADVISFRVPSPASLKEVGRTALTALGYDLKRDRSATIIWGIVRELLQKRQTLFLHIDEVQDLKTSQSKQVIQNVINTLKSLMQHPEWPISIILSGMPEVRKMLNFDPQLARRFYPIALRPLSFTGDEEMLRDMVGSYLHKAALPPSSGIYTDEVLMRLLHAGAYEFGIVIEIIIAGIGEALMAGSDCLLLEHFAMAFRRRTGCYDGLNPFLAPDYRDIDPRKLFPEWED